MATNLMVWSASPALIGNSREMEQVRVAVAKLAACDFTLLITGESGTGKEVVARMIHARSRRHAGPFVAVSGAALVDSLLEAELFGIEDRTATGVRGRAGKLELADGGTFFLDEVAELSKHAQAALLRALQDLTIERVGGHRSRRVDTRIIVATNQPLRELVMRKRFRSDLYYRLSGVEITLPPLRARPGDVRQLAEHFLRLHGRDDQLPTGVVSALTAYDWPGNVRELERYIQNAVAWSKWPEIQRELLEGHPRETSGCSIPDPDESLRAVATRYIEAVLKDCRGNKALACRRLRISFHTLQKHLGARKTARPNGGFVSDSA
jgi:transcriptional regulator with PAS, ATPase and Fis domain